ncbi:MAG TPA: hypothetical protein PLT00_11650 [Verrucomicrobiota bacterium]|jgi:hypothetical protein|nr:hypothetical protein [Verrucomicrobiota bacterium]HQB17356.1 hypothetical protein [Verrucomicrobiota bacterium]
MSGHPLIKSKQEKHIRSYTYEEVIRTYAAGLMAASTLLAVEIGDKGQIYFEEGKYQPGGGWGGEFTVTPIPGDGGPVDWLNLSGYADKLIGPGADGRKTFQSFCLEIGEFVTETKKYHAEITSAAIKGGVQDPKGDPISIGTSWLYSQFAKGQLNGYAYEGTEDARKRSAIDLQLAIWWLEDEIIDGQVHNDHKFELSSNIFMEVLLAEFGNDKDGVKKDADPNTWGVYVLHLLDEKWEPAQDILYCQIPTGGGGGVPDGGFTLLLLGSAMAGLSVVRRKLG